MNPTNEEPAMSTPPSREPFNVHRCPECGSVPTFTGKSDGMYHYDAELGRLVKCKDQPAPAPPAGGEVPFPWAGRCPEEQAALDEMNAPADRAEGETPMTDAMYTRDRPRVVYWDFARTLERECQTKDARIAELEREARRLREKVAYAESYGLIIGWATSTDRPDGYWAHTHREGSTLDRIFDEWSDAIGWDITKKRLRDALTAVLASAHPSPTEHPGMAAAWKAGQEALAAGREQLPPAPGVDQP